MSTDLTPEYSTAGGNVEASTELKSLLNSRIPGLLSMLSQKINIDQIKAESGKLRDLDITKVELGNASIENIILADTHAALNGGQAFLENVHVELTLKLTLGWKVDGPGPLDKSGEKDLEEMLFSFDLGNVSVPSLSNINMQIPSLRVPNVNASMKPITNIDLGGASMKKITAKDTDAPTGGFSLTGMGIGSANIENISIPKTTTAKITMEEFAPNTDVKLPGAEVRNLQIPAANVANINTGSFDISTTPNLLKKDLDVDLGGIVKLKIGVEPIIDMNIGSLTINDSEISATVSKLNIDNIQIPVTVRGIQMNDLDIGTIKINKISL